MVAPLGPIVSSLTLAAGGCAWDTRRGKSPEPTANEPVVLDKYDVYTVIDALQRDKVAVGQCTLDEVKFNSADNSEQATKNANLTRLAIAERILIKFEEYNKLPDSLKIGVIKLTAEELGKREGDASLESLLTTLQGWNYSAYCRTHDTWYAPATYGQLPEAITLKNFNVSDVKALIEKAKVVPLSISPNTGMVGQTLTVTLTSNKLPADIAEAELAVDFGDGITTDEITAAEQGKVNIKITIDADAKPGVRDVSVKTGEKELVGGKGLFAITKPVAEVRPKIIRVETPAPAPAQEETPKPVRVHKPKPAQAPADDFGAAPQL